MIKISKITFLLVVISLLVGCSWVRPNTARSTHKFDYQKCIDKSKQMYPVMMVKKTYGEGYHTPIKTNCTSYGSGNHAYTNCTTTGGEYVPPTTGTTDVNSDKRNDAFGSCMRSKGYKKKWFWQQ
jgi:hypothetical protein